MQAYLERIANKRLALIGVGNRLRGDDGAGPALVDLLRGRHAAFLIDAGDVPEDYYSVVERATPQVVVIADAVDMGARPGDIAMLEIEQLAGAPMTTHNTGIATFAQALKMSLAADVFVLAIQPAGTALGAPISDPVLATLEYLAELIGGTNGSPTDECKHTACEIQ